MSEFDEAWLRFCQELGKLRTELTQAQECVLDLKAKCEALEAALEEVDDNLYYKIKVQKNSIYGIMKADLDEEVDHHGNKTTDT